MNDILKQANRLYEFIPSNRDTDIFYLFINNSNYKLFFRS